MGDRCYFQITLHGHIEDLDTLDKVIEALKAENMDPTDDDGAYMNNGRNTGHMKAFAHAIGFEKNPVFVHDEKNYANASTLEDVLQQLNIPYAVYHGAGDSYGPGRWTFRPTPDGLPTFGKYEASLTRD